MDVARVQNLLNKNLAYSPPPLWVDGTFGPLTDRKVREFQSKRRLTMDGIVGADTWAALEGKPVSTPGGIGKAIAGAFPAQGFGSISKAVSSIVKDFGPGTKHFK